jgi:hypothetical protein
MAVSWYAAFRDIPWKKALSVAPSIVEGGRKLWNRIDSLEVRTAQLGEEAASSFEVVRAIAEQHSQLAEQHAQLVDAVDVLIVRTYVLLWTCAILALAVVALVLVALAR